MYGTLSAVQERKLRQLSFVSLGARHKRIPYGMRLCQWLSCCHLIGSCAPASDMLKEALQIYDVRELEDLLLDTFYAGLVIGKIDAFAETVCVEFTIGRDVREVQRGCWRVFVRASQVVVAGKLIRRPAAG